MQRAAGEGSVCAGLASGTDITVEERKQAGLLADMKRIHHSRFLHQSCLAPFNNAVRVGQPVLSYLVRSKCAYNPVTRSFSHAHAPDCPHAALGSPQVH